jgi:uncharacterized protein YaeQ
MALPSTVYRASIELAHVDRNRYASLQATVARHPSETAERLVLRLLAFVLCYDEGLAFTRGICAGDEPDLWVKEGDGRVSLWVEVGLPDPERLLKASRHAGRVVLVAAGPSRWSWERQHLERLSASPNITVLGLDQELIAGLVDRLQRAVAWGVTVSDATMYVDVGGETVQGGVALLAGPALD